MNNISFENLKNIQKSTIGMFMQVAHKEFCLYSIDFLNSYSSCGKGGLKLWVILLTNVMTEEVNL